MNHIGEPDPHPAVQTSASGDSPRLRRRAARIDEILARAMARVEAGGLDALTLGGVARDLDYTVAALYRYFPSKDALVGELQRRVVALVDHKLAEVEQRCAGWLAARPGAAIEPIRLLVPVAAAGLFYAGLARSAPQVFGLLAASLGDPRRLIDDAQARGVIETAQPMFVRIASHVERAARAGALGDGDEMSRAVTLWGAVHGVAQLGKLTPIAPELLQADRMVEELLHALLVGWGADPELAAETIRALSEAALAECALGAGELATVARASLPEAAQR